MVYPAPQFIIGISKRHPPITRWCKQVTGSSRHPQGETTPHRKQSQLTACWIVERTLDTRTKLEVMLTSKRMTSLEDKYIYQPVYPRSNANPISLFPYKNALCKSIYSNRKHSAHIYSPLNHTTSSHLNLHPSYLYRDSL